MFTRQHYPLATIIGKNFKKLLHKWMNEEIKLFYVLKSATFEFVHVYVAYHLNQKVIILICYDFKVPIISLGTLRA
jgi:hypothetical protein